VAPVGGIQDCPACKHRVIPRGGRCPSCRFDIGALRSPGELSATVTWQVWRDLSVHQAQRLPIVSALLVTVGACGLTLMGWILLSSWDRMGVFQWLLALLYITLLGRLLRFGRRIGVKSAVGYLAETALPIVFYCRAFRTDNEQQIMEFFRSPEERLVRELNRLAPAVALSTMDERYSRLGALRLRVPPGEWLGTAVRLMTRSAAIVVRVDAMTETIEWEISTAVALGLTEKLIFFFPPHNSTEGAGDYLTSVGLIAERLHQLLEVTRPPIGSDGGLYMYQDGQWSSTAVHGPGLDAFLRPVGELLQPTIADEIADWLDAAFEILTLLPVLIVIIVVAAVVFGIIRQTLEHTF